MESAPVLPLWQPDSEVSECQVCHADFSFWYRKHHCRKCGRVICAACSPHRITIPTQYVVQPPAGRENELSWTSAHSSLTQTPDPPQDSALVVRVCKPCVPDPWTPQASTHDWQRPLLSHQAYPPDHDHFRRSHVSETMGLPPSRPHWQVEPSLRSPTSAAESESRHTPHWQVARNARSSTSTTEPGSQRAEQPQRHRRHTTSERRYTQTSASSSISRSEPPLPPLPPRHNRPARRSSHAPRRVISEADECPVCGCELPAGDAIREEHIIECISSRFSSTPSQSNTTSNQPSTPANRTSDAATEHTTSAEGTPVAVTAAAANRPRASSYRPRGMAIYRATEKDCTTEDGEPQECIICFEEFQAGDELGRMECLCKFHRLCIRQWWDTKGTGSCPTHQLHE